MVDSGEGSMQIVFPDGDGVCSGWGGFKGVRDGPVVSADEYSDEVIREVEDSKHRGVKGGRAVA